MSITQQLVTSIEVVTSLEELGATAAGYVEAARSASTLRAYRSDWRHFAGWCEQRRLAPLPATPEVVALYLTDFAGVLATSTLQRRLVSIAEAHRAAGHEPPTTATVVRSTWRGIRRTFGTEQRGKAPARTSEVRAMVGALDLDRLIGVRDRALILIGFAGALRRSELVALDVANIDRTSDGLVVHVQRSKTDQEGAGERLGLPYGSDPLTCPVRALEAWTDASEITTGALFRPVTRHGHLATSRLSDRAVAEIVKRAARAAGLDPAVFAGHSLRAGLITSAAEAGVAERDIMRHSRHRSVPVMRRYIRGATLFQANAAAAVGL